MTNAQSRSTKAMLTRAEKTKDRAAILAACDKAEAIFNRHGWPDWWSRIERMRSDAYFMPDAPAGSCRDCGDPIPAPASGSKYHNLCGVCLRHYV